MSDPIKPTGGNHPSDPTGKGHPSSPPPFPKEHAGSGMTMTKMMALMTPKQKKQFEAALTQSLTNQIKRSSDRYIDELRRERSGE